MQDNRKYKRRLLPYTKRMRKYKRSKRAMKEIRIVINCDEGFVADTLRDIATQYENGEYAQFGFYEVEHGVGTIEETEL